MPKKFLKKPPWGLLLLLVAVGAGLLIFSGRFSRSRIEAQERKIGQLARRIEVLKAEQVPLRFRITEKNDSAIAVDLACYDTRGKQLGKKTFRLKGKELAFDFIVVSVNRHKLAFPYKLFSDEIPPDKGYSLLPLYDRQNFPATFANAGYPRNVREGIGALFEKIKAGETESLPQSFGSAVHDLKALQEFLPGQTYKIVTRTKGGIEVMPDS